MRIQKEIRRIRNYPETDFTGIVFTKLELLRDHYDVELSECQAINETHLGGWMDWSQKTIAKDEGYQRFTQKSMFDTCNSCYVDGDKL